MADGSGSGGGVESSASAVGAEKTADKGGGAEASKRQAAARVISADFNTARAQGEQFPAGKALGNLADRNGTPSALDDELKALNDGELPPAPAEPINESDAQALSQELNAMDTAEEPVRPAAEAPADEPKQSVDNQTDSQNKTSTQPDAKPGGIRNAVKNFFGPRPTPVIDNLDLRRPPAQEATTTPSKPSIEMASDPAQSEQNAIDRARQTLGPENTATTAEQKTTDETSEAPLTPEQRQAEQRMLRDETIAKLKENNSNLDLRDPDLQQALAEAEADESGEKFKELQRSSDAITEANKALAEDESLRQEAEKTLTALNSEQAQQLAESFGIPLKDLQDYILKGMGEKATTDAKKGDEATKKKMAQWKIILAALLVVVSVPVIATGLAIGTAGKSLQQG